MNDKVFIDTNICIYCYSDDELDKSEIARNLIIDNNFIFIFFSIFSK